MGEPGPAMLTIVADEAIPFVREAFGLVGQVQALPEVEITPEAVRTADLLVVRTVTRVDRRLLDGSSVRWAGTVTIGMDHLDLPYLQQRGIAYASAPGCNANSVCEYVAAALLRLAVEVGFELSGLRLGIVGVGNIGSRVARMARALGMTPLLCDPPRARAEGEDGFVPLEQLLAESDVVTLHVPLSKEGPDSTWHLADERFFAALRPGTIFINTSRGNVVDEAALRSAVDRGCVSAAVLDVWSGEPNISPETAARAEIATPHIAGYSFEGRVNGTRQVFEAACRALGLAATWDAAPLLPPPPVPLLRLAADGRPAAQVLDDAVRAVYAIRRDDEKLREALRLPAGEIAQAVRTLRSRYPQRRELAATRLELVSPSPALLAAAAGLGFTMGA